MKHICLLIVLFMFVYTLTIVTKSKVNKDTHTNIEVIDHTLTIEDLYQLTPEEKFVARVIYSEAGPQCSNNERRLVASVIKNRIRHAGFQNAPTMFSVV